MKNIDLLKMTSRFVRLCVYFVGLYLWIILMVHEIQGYSYIQKPPWNSFIYNNNAKPVNNAAQFMYPRFPNMFGNMQRQQYISNFKKNKWSVNGRWVYSGNWINNKFIKTANLQSVPIFSFVPLRQQMTTIMTPIQLGQENLWNENKEATFVNKNFSINHDVPPITENPENIQKTTQIQQTEENSRMISTISTTELAKPDKLNPASVCDNSTFCVHSINYPEELVNQEIRQNSSLKLLESIDQLSEISVRLDDEMNYSSMCRGNVQLIFPRSAKTMDQDWVHVVNQKNFQQGVRIETCAQEGKECGDFKDNLPSGYNVFCRQKYSYRVLIAVINDKMTKETFRFPSSCCCYEEFDF